MPARGQVAKLTLRGKINAIESVPLNTRQPFDPDPFNGASIKFLKKFNELFLNWQVFLFVNSYLIKNNV